MSPRSRARGPELLRFAYLLCGDRHRAQDLVQDVVLNMHRRFAGALPLDNPFGYARRTLANANVSRSRRLSSREVVVDAVPNAAAVEPDAADRDLLWQALRRLPDRQRTVLVLRTADAPLALPPVSDARTYLERFAKTLPGAASGLLRPRQPTGAELADVSFAEPPTATAGVRIHALLQNEWDAPTAAVIEGQLTPPTTRMAIGAFLVEHPSGTFLADAGICADAHTRHLAEMPALVRSLTAGPPPRAGIADAVTQAGFDPAQLLFALLTHVHWDHVSGLAELPGLTARVDERDLPLVVDGAPFQPGVVPATTRDVRFAGLRLDGPPILTFPASHDVFGDGSVVLCDLSGHTPGHSGILLALQSGRRVLLAGDAIWNVTQLRLVRQRSAIARLADADPDAAYRTIVRLSRLPAGVTVLPSHDHATITATFAGGPLE